LLQQNWFISRWTFHWNNRKRKEKVCIFSSSTASPFFLWWWHSNDLKHLLIDMFDEPILWLMSSSHLVCHSRVYTQKEGRSSWWWKDAYFFFPFSIISMKSPSWNESILLQQIHTSIPESDVFIAFYYSSASFVLLMAFFSFFMSEDEDCLRNRYSHLLDRHRITNLTSTRWHNRCHWIV